MKRSELIEAVAKRTGSTQAHVREIVEAIEGVICDAAGDGEGVMWTGLAKFEIKEVPAQERWVPSAKERRMFPAKVTAKIRPQKKLIDAAASSR